MTGEPMTTISAGALAILAPIAGSLLSLLGGWPARIGRWGSIAVASAIIAGGTGAMLREGAFVRVMVPETPVAVFCWDWTTTIIAGVALVSALLSFLCSPPDAGEDSMALFQLAMALGVALAGNALALWPLLSLSAGALALFVLGSRGPRSVATAIGGALSLLGAAVGAYGLARALHLSRDEPISLFDLCLFPAESLTSAALLGLGFLGGLAAVVGGFPFTLKHATEWAAMGPRRAAAAIGLGPGAIALWIWLKVAVHGRVALQASLGVPAVRWALYGGVVLGIAWHLASLLIRREAREVRRTLWGLQWCYGLLALLLGTADGIGLYAFVLWAAQAVLCFGGLAIADRTTGRASVLLQVASWASLLGAPPLAGFWGRYVLVKAIARVHGDLWWVALIPWAIEVVVVLLAFDLVSRGRHATDAEEPHVPSGDAVRCPRPMGMLSAGLCIALHLGVGPLALVVSDALARQIVTGAATW